MIGPDPSYAWILARDKAISETVRERILSVARLGGVDTDKLIWVSDACSRSRAQPFTLVARRSQAAQQLWQTLNLSGTVQESNWNDALKPIEAGHKIAKSTPLFHKIDSDEAKLEESLAQLREKTPPK